MDDTNHQASEQISSRALTRARLLSVIVLAPLACSRGANELALYLCRCSALTKLPSKSSRTDTAGFREASQSPASTAPLPLQLARFHPMAA